MLETLRKRRKDESGFTLVELLVVMLILGILAAIAIPSFFNQREKAKDADAKASVRTAQTAIETYATDNDGVYTGANYTALTGIESTLTEVAAADMTVTAGSNTYSITVKEPDTAHTFTISRAAAGTTTLSCTPTTGAGGCPSGGNWG